MKVGYSVLVNDVRNRAGGIVFSNWRGIPTARVFRAPANPKTTSQQQVRMVFTGANKMYAAGSGAIGWRAGWWDAARGRPAIGRNLFLGSVVDIGAGQAATGSWGTLDFFPLGGDATPAPTLQATAGNDQIVVRATLPATPKVITGYRLYLVGLVSEDNITAAAMAGTQIKSVAWGTAVQSGTLTFGSLTDTQHVVRIMPIYVKDGSTVADYRSAVFRGPPVRGAATPT